MTNRASGVSSGILCPRIIRLLKTKLSEAEVHYIEERLSEERFSVAMLQFMSPTNQDFGERSNRPEPRSGSAA